MCAMSDSAEHRRLAADVQRLKKEAEEVGNRVFKSAGTPDFDRPSSEQLLRLQYQALWVRVEMSEMAEASVSKCNLPDECPVCMTEFDKKFPKASQLMPCRHIMCSACLHRVDEIRRQDRAKYGRMFSDLESRRAYDRLKWRTCPLCRCPAPSERTISGGASVLPQSRFGRDSLSAFNKEFTTKNVVMQSVSERVAVMSESF